MSSRAALFAFCFIGLGLAGLFLYGPRPALAQQGVAREIWFHNACNKPIRLLVRHAEQPRRWQSRGWWQLPGAGRPRALSLRGTRLKHLTNHRLYYYAEATDGSMVWEGRRAATRLGGVTYRLRQATPTVVRGRLQVRITCTRSTGPAKG